MMQPWWGDEMEGLFVLLAFHEEIPPIDSTGQPRINRAEPK